MKYRLGPLSREGPWPVDVIAAGTFPSREEVASLLAAGSLSRVLILQRVLPSRREIRALRDAYGAVIFDFDDAIYAAMPDIRGSRLKLGAKRVLRLAVRGSTTASSRRRRLTKVLREVDVCVVGNEILAQFARRYAKRVVEIPSTVDPIEAPPAGRSEPPVLVWTGVAGNRQYLELLRDPLTRLAGELDFKLRIVCSRNWEDSPVDVEFVPWSQQAEHDALLSATVGLAPVTDDPFSRGKCQYRSLLFGGHGLPTVASPVGIMDRIVVHGETGFLARTEDEWLESLRSCLSQPALAAELGAKALDRVRASYSHRVGVERWTELLNELAAGARPA
jgi:glycosyltransferase involved in cell wall biosynthesis